MSQPVLLHRDGVIATLTLNRPEVLNTLDFAMVDALVARTAEVAADDTLRVVILRGAGKHFMAGGDVRTFAGELQHAPAERRMRFQRMLERVHAAVEHLHRMPHPLVCGVQGAVAGIGISFMNACDLVVAADNAYFNSAYSHIAVTPDGGGTWALPRIVGLRKAMEIVLLAERFDAAEALRVGLVNKVVAAQALDAAVDAYARTLAAAPVLAVRNAKRLLRDSFAHTLSEQLQAEAVSFAQCTATADFAEGITAFIEKRPARFGQG
jgi:2-(1,2-epoxy-1,2-dihydrophenyl)acetyl-CoA isomerase